MRREYTLAELAAAVGMTERNVRAYRSRGLIRPPRLRGRVGYYGFDHLTQLRLVQALTGRGLSLQVVSQLIEKGLAQHELARLIREDLPEGPPVPLAGVVVEEITKSDPELLDALAEHGVVRTTETGVEADPAMLALANQLASHGVAVIDVTRVVLTGAEAAACAEDGLRRGLSAPRRPPVPGPARGDSSNGEPSEAEGRAGEPEDELVGETPRPSTRPADDGPVDPDAAGAQPPDAAATAVAVELATMAFRISLESRLSRPAP